MTKEILEKAHRLDRRLSWLREVQLPSPENIERGFGDFPTFALQSLSVQALKKIRAIAEADINSKIKDLERAFDKL